MKCGTDDLLPRMRALATDHAPDGWPAVRMRDITALAEWMVELARRTSLSVAQGKAV